MSVHDPRSREISLGEGQFRQRPPRCTVALRTRTNGSSSGYIRHITTQPVRLQSLSTLPASAPATVPTETAQTLTKKQQQKKKKKKRLISITMLRKRLRCHLFFGRFFILFYTQVYQVGLEGHATISNTVHFLLSFSLLPRVSVYTCRSTHFWILVLGCLGWIHFCMCKAFEVFQSDVQTSMYCLESHRPCFSRGIPHLTRAI